jgi:hypothetical protein
MRWWCLGMMVACNGAGEATDGKGGGDDSDLTGTEETSFGADVQPILATSCALGGCHSGPELQTGLDLTAGQAYNQLVDRPSFQVAGMLRVEPGNTDNSYLIRKMEGTFEAVGGTGDLMPPGFGLSETDIGVVKAWISDGALEN